MHDAHPGTRVCIIFYEIRLKRQDGCDLIAVGFGIPSCVYHLLRHESSAFSEFNVCLIVRLLGTFVPHRKPGQDMRDAVRPNRASHISYGS